MPYISVIAPTLNEGKYLGNLLTSIERQAYRDFEVIVVDGGSSDKTLDIAETFGAKTILLPNTKEFPSRNKAAEIASGEILLFTGADVVFPDNLLGNIARKFERDGLLAVAGPGIPYDASFIFKIEFFLYNSMRCFFAHLPKRFRRFSTSTNLLAVRRDAFIAVGGLDPDDVNADGMLGRKLCSEGDVWFSYSKVKAYMSARRINEMGALRFNAHFAYVLENFFPSLSQTAFIQRNKGISGQNHSQMRKQEIIATMIDSAQLEHSQLDDLTELAPK